MNTTNKLSVFFNYFKVLSSNVGGKVLAFIILPIIAKKLGPTEFGTFSVYTAIVGFSTSLIMMRFNEFLLVDFYESDRKEFSNTIKNGALIALVITSFVSLISLLFKKDLESWLGISIGWVVLAFVYSLLSWFYQLVLYLSRLYEKISLYTLIDFFNHVGLALGTGFFILYLGFGWEGRVYSQYSISVFIIFLLAYLYFYVFKLKTNYFRFKIREILAFCLPLIPHSFVPFVRVGLDKIILVGVIGKNDLGVYSLAMTLAIGFNLFLNSFFTIFQPKLYASFKAKGEPYYHVKLTLTMLSGLSTLMIVGYFLIQILVQSYFDKEYIDALQFLPYILLDVFLFFLFRLLNIPIFYKRKVKIFGIGIGVGLILQVICMYLFSVNFGIFGVIGTLVGFELLRVLFSFYIGKFHLGLQLKW